MDWVRIMVVHTVVRHSVNISHEFCDAFVGLVLFFCFFSASLPHFSAVESSVYCSSTIAILLAAEGL